MPTSSEKLRKLYLEKGDKLFLNKNMLKGYIADVLHECNDMKKLRNAAELGVASKIISDVTSTKDNKNIKNCVDALVEENMWNEEIAIEVVKAFVYAKFGQTPVISCNSSTNSTKNISSSPAPIFRDSNDYNKQESTYTEKKSGLAKKLGYAILILFIIYLAVNLISSIADIINKNNTNAVGVTVATTTATTTFSRTNETTTAQATTTEKIVETTEPVTEVIAEVNPFDEYLGEWYSANSYVAEIKKDGDGYSFSAFILSIGGGGNVFDSNANFTVDPNSNTVTGEAYDSWKTSDIEFTMTYEPDKITVTSLGTTLTLDNEVFYRENPNKELNANFQKEKLINFSALSSEDSAYLSKNWSFISKEFPIYNTILKDTVLYSDSSIYDNSLVYFNHIFTDDDLSAYTKDEIINAVSVCLYCESVAFRNSISDEKFADFAAIYYSNYNEIPWYLIDKFTPKVTAFDGGYPNEISNTITADNDTKISVANKYFDAEISDSGIKLANADTLYVYNSNEYNIIKWIFADVAPSSVALKEKIEASTVEVADVFEKDYTGERALTQTEINNTEIYEWSEEVVKEIVEEQLNDYSITLGDLEKVTEVSIIENNDLVDLSDLTNMPNLERLTISKCNNLTDLYYFKELDNLKYLEFSYNDNITDFSYFSGLTNLTELILLNSHDGYNDKISFSILSNMKKMKDLTIVGFYNVVDCNAISNMVALESLVFKNGGYSLHHSRWFYVENLDFLSTLVNLKSLDISRLYIKNNVDGLGYLKNLEYLNYGVKMYDNKGDIPLGELTSLTTLISNKLSGNLDYLTSLKNLTTLNLSNNEYGNFKLPDLSELTNLTYINLSNCGSVNAIANCTNLKELYLDYTTFSDLSSLSGSPNLEKLSLHNDRYYSKDDYDITPLADLTSLTYLNVGGNGIKSVEAFSGLSNLTYLNLSNNEISSVAPLKDLPATVELDLSGNNITNFKPVDHIENLTK